MATDTTQARNFPRETPSRPAARRCHPDTHRCPVSCPPLDLTSYDGRPGVAGMSSIAWPRAAGTFDHDRVIAAVREILIGVGEDPERDGLRDTPERVARAYAEMFHGLREEPESV